MAPGTTKRHRADRPRVKNSKNQGEDSSQVVQPKAIRHDSSDELQSSPSLPARFHVQKIDSARSRNAELAKKQRSSSSVAFSDYHKSSSSGRGSYGYTDSTLPDTSPNPDARSHKRKERNGPNTSSSSTVLSKRARLHIHAPSLRVLHEGPLLVESDAEQSDATEKEEEELCRILWAGVPRRAKKPSSPAHGCVMEQVLPFALAFVLTGRAGPASTPWPEGNPSWLSDTIMRSWTRVAKASSRHKHRYNTGVHDEPTPYEARMIRDEFSQWRSHAMAIVRLVVEGSYDSVDFEKTDEHPTIFNKLLHDDSFACEDFNQASRRRFLSNIIVKALARTIYGCDNTGLAQYTFATKLCRPMGENTVILICTMIEHSLRERISSEYRPGKASSRFEGHLVDRAWNRIRKSWDQQCKERKSLILALLLERVDLETNYQPSQTLMVASNPHAYDLDDLPSLKVPLLNAHSEILISQRPSTPFDSVDEEAPQDLLVLPESRGYVMSKVDFQAAPAVISDTNNDALITAKKGKDATKDKVTFKITFDDPDAPNPRTLTFNRATVTLAELFETAMVPIGYALYWYGHEGEESQSGDGPLMSLDGDKDGGLAELLYDCTESVIHLREETFLGKD